MKKEENKIIIYSFLFIVALIIRIVGPKQTFFVWTRIMSHISHSVILIFFVLVISQIIAIFVKDYTLRRIANYMLLIATGLAVFFIFQDKLIAASVSLGIVAAAFTFIFQTPVLSLVGWIYLSMGRIYSTGDRIRLGNIKGDVIDVSPLRTKLLEIGGEYVQADLPSGRIATFPNSMLLTDEIINYTKFFPYIYADVPFHLTYETDFNFVFKIVRDIISKNIKNDKKDMENSFNRLKRRFGIKEEFEPIKFNITPSWTWIEFRVTFPLDPREQSNVLTKVTKDILEEFQKHPGKVKFPRGRTR